MKMLDQTNLAALDAMTRGDNSPESLRLNAIAIRVYGRPAVEIVLEKRREYRAKLGAWQRRWQSGVSRRPQRGAHHDSWAIRESYVRYPDRSYVDFIDLCHRMILVRVEGGATRLGVWIPQWLDSRR